MASVGSQTWRNRLSARGEHEGGYMESRKQYSSAVAGLTNWVDRGKHRSKVISGVNVCGAERLVGATPE